MQGKLSAQEENVGQPSTQQRKRQCKPYKEQVALETIFC